MPDISMDMSLGGETDVWFNFKTGKSEHKSKTWEPQTDDEARQYIPQDSATQGIYTAQRGIGYTILDAVQSALEAVAIGRLE